MSKRIIPQVIGLLLMEYLVMLLFPFCLLDTLFTDAARLHNNAHFPVVLTLSARASLAQRLMNMS